jgi:hypothetical protein
MGVLLPWICKLLCGGGMPRPQQMAVLRWWYRGGVLLPLLLVDPDLEFEARAMGDGLEGGCVGMVLPL